MSYVFPKREPPAAPKPTTCNCHRQLDRFIKPTVVADARGQLHLLVGGMAVRPATVEIVADRESGTTYVVASVPLALVDVLSWDELKARRAEDRIA